MAGRSAKFTPSAIFEPLYGDKLSIYYYQIFNEYYNYLFIYLFTITNRKNRFAISTWPQPPTFVTPSRTRVSLVKTVSDLSNAQTPTTCPSL